MEQYIGLGIIGFCVSTAAWIWVEIYRAKAALDEERIRRKLLEYELAEAKKRAELDAESLDHIVERRNSNKGRGDI